MKFLNNTCLRTNFSARSLSKSKHFSLCRKRYTTTKKSVLSPYDPTKLAIHSILRPQVDLISNCGPNVKKTVSFDDVVHFIDEENIVISVDFDCGITFFYESPTKFRQINRERNYISRSCENPQCIPSKDQHICSVDEQHSFNIFLNPYNLWNMVPAAFMSLNHTNNTYSMSNQYPQQTTHQSRTDSYHIRCSLHCEPWTVKARACILSKILLTGRTRERNS